jgi:hypothetical protein
MFYIEILGLKFRSTLQSHRAMDFFSESPFPSDASRRLFWSRQCRTTTVTATLSAIYSLLRISTPYFYTYILHHVRVAIAFPCSGGEGRSSIKIAASQWIPNRICLQVGTILFYMTAAIVVSHAVEQLP